MSASPATRTDTGGIGGTLGNALALAATRATLEHVLTEEYYARSIPLADRFLAGVQEVIADFGVPWTVQRLGNRVEYWFRPTPAQRRRSGRRHRRRPGPPSCTCGRSNCGILMTPLPQHGTYSPQTTAAT